MSPIWLPCICGDYWCARHGMPAHDCACPPIEDWTADPYATGGPMPETFTMRVTQVQTNRLDLADNVPLFLTLVGKLETPIETLLPLLRAQNAQRPVVTVTLTLEAPDGA